MKLAEKNTVFYDGDCGFCKRSIQVILKKRKVDFYFLPLQSKTAKTILKKRGVKIELNTMYYLKNGILFQKSEAALQIARNLCFPYPSLFYLGKLVPRFLRDKVYDIVAQNRHRLHQQSCVLPTAEEKKFFIE